MVGYSSDADSLAVKLLTYFPENMSIHNIPNLQGIVLLLDSTTGSIRAVGDLLESTTNQNLFLLLDD